MPKYRQRTEIIDADLYRPGLEDGFACTDSKGQAYIRRDGLSRLVDPGEPRDSGRRRVPIILTRGGFRIVEHGDYVITCAQGQRIPIRALTFAELYEAVEQDPTGP